SPLPAPTLAGPGRPRRLVRPGSLRRPRVRIPDLRRPRSLLGRSLQTLQRIRYALVKAARAQALQQPAPPPRGEGGVSPVAQRAAMPVDRCAHNPVVADDSKREGRAEQDMMPLGVHFLELAVDLPTP